MDTLAEAFIKLSFLPVTLLCIYTVWVYNQLPPVLKTFSHFIFFSAAIQVSSTLLWFLKMNNMPLLHVYVSFGFILIMRFYTQLLDGYVDKRIIRVTVILFLLFVAIDLFFFESVLRFTSNTLTIESILLIIISLFTYIFLLDNISRETFWRLSKSLNWINSGIFFYYSTSLLIFYFGDMFSHSFPVTLNWYIWGLHSLFSATMYACSFIGLWIRPHN